ncbi:MAG: multidrug effflux MFS transporter [Deltaproteobacteria bacterium]|jgi:DHA1 family bicyclomycin/chloramphenicol resistance-like MFS transporter|nr:multidrug effflux MFS transporter [Deltaproteobacteria bacterium]
MTELAKNASAPSPKAALIILLGVLTAFAPLSTDMYLAAFPAMAKDLGTDEASVQLSLAVFFLGLALGQLIWGPLSDRLGRRRPLMAGLIVYALASAGLALSGSVSTFLILRFIQALGGCAGMVVSRAVVRDLFDLESSAVVLTLMMAVQSLGPVVAPVLGAYVLTLAPWPAVFWLLLILGLGCLASSWKFLNESHPPERRVRQSLGEISRTLLSLLRLRPFIVPTLAGALGGSAIIAFVTASPFVLMSVFGLSRTSFAWVFAMISLGSGLFAQTNIIVLKKLSARKILSLAIAALITLSLILLIISWPEYPPPLWVFLVLLFPTLAMCPIIFANSTALAMASSGRYAGSASSIIGTIQFGLAGLISVMVSVFHDGTARPMVGAILAFGLAGAALLLADKLIPHKL